MTTSPQHRVEQRGRIMLAARTCFIQRGFHATGMGEIAKLCRMSVGNIYHYFPNKNAIVQAITDEFRSRTFPMLRPLADHASPVEGLIKIMLLSLQEISAEANIRLWVEILAEVSRNSEICKICQDFDRDFRDILERLMARAMESGELPPDTDLEATSLWMMALLDGAITRLSADPKLDVQRIQNTLAQALRSFFQVAPV